MESQTILFVNNAEYVRDYVLRITFNNGDVRLFDFSNEFSKGICRKLQDIDYFKKFRLDPFSIDWNNEIGFAPEYLFKHGVSSMNTFQPSK